MRQIHNGSRNLSSASIWKALPSSMLVHTLGYEKTGSSFIGFDDLKIIGRILRPIKSRIETAVNSFSIPTSGGLGLAVGSYAAFSQTGSAHLAQ